VQFGIVQGVTIEDSFDIKKLYGANKYPVDIGGGKGDLNIKCEQAVFNAQLFNAVYYGQTLTAGYQALYSDTIGASVPTGAGATSIIITPTAPYGGTSGQFVDLGVQDAAGNPYIRVASSPTGGQYALTGVATGATYLFGNQSAGNTVFISYGYSNTTNPTTGQTLNILNVPMGQQPVFSCQFFNKRFSSASGNTASFWRQFPACVATKLTMGFKNDDFVIPNFEIQCFQGPNNVVQKMAFSGN
jgi:hypothetical protein